MATASLSFCSSSGVHSRLCHDTPVFGIILDSDGSAFDRRVVKNMNFDWDSMRLYFDA